MKLLHIMDYRRQVLGTLSQDRDGRIRLDLFASAYEREFSALLKAITESPMPLHTYERTIMAGVDRLVSKIVYLRPSDPDFLWAVSEYVNRHPLGSIPVIGHMVNISPRGSSVSVSPSAGTI